MTPIQLVAFVLCLGCTSVFCQIEVTKAQAKAIPTGAEYQGDLIDVINIKDKLGLSSVIVSQTPVRPSKTWRDSKESELFVYRYVTQKANSLLHWKVYDFVKECPLDVEATLLGGTHARGVSVTDLDNDNDAEVWVGYRVICRGDVSPATVKIIMYEGKSKYAVRGTSKVKISETEYDGGKYEFDRAFDSAPEAFRNFAQKVWGEIVTE